MTDKQEMNPADELASKGFQLYFNDGDEEGNLFRSEEDQKKGLEMITQAAEMGSVGAMLDLGLIYSLSRQYVLAFKWYKKAAELGDEFAMINLAEMYEEGEGVRKSYVKAFKIRQSLAEKGNEHASVQLGCMYEDGKGVKRDLAKAEELYLVGAESGNVYSQYCLAALYDRQKRYGEAIKWYAKAAEQGDTEASERLAELTGETD